MSTTIYIQLRCKTALQCVLSKMIYEYWLLFVVYVTPKSSCSHIVTICFLKIPKRSKKHYVSLS